MANSVGIPTTQDEASSYTIGRGLVILGGIVSSFVLLPTVPYVWVAIGAILVPIVWIKTGRTKSAKMIASGCTTKSEWTAFVASLPKNDKAKLAARAEQQRYADNAEASKQLSRQQAESSRLAAVEQRTRAQISERPKYPLRFANRSANIEVVGEAYYEASVIAALGGLRLDEEKTVDDVETFLIPEPDNPYGAGQAVMVWMNGYHVGYLSSEDAARFNPVLARIFLAGYIPETIGRIWGVTRQDYGAASGVRHHLYARVALSGPEQLLPTNDPPKENYSLLPHGSAIQVSKEADYMAELTEHLHGPDSYAIATLQLTSRMLKNGTTRENVTVYIDGDQIGELTPATSEKLAPAIRHLDDCGYATATWARVKGSPVAIEVTLYAAKAHEIPVEWFSSLPVTVPTLGNGSRSRQNGTQADQNIQREANWDF